MMTLQLDDYSKAEEIKPGIIALRQTSTITGKTYTQYYSIDMLRYLAKEIVNYEF